MEYTIARALEQQFAEALEEECGEKLMASRDELAAILDLIQDEIADEAARIARAMLSQSAETLRDMYNIKIIGELEEDHADS